MRCLLKIKSPKKTAVIPYKEIPLDRPVITVGRAAAEDLRLTEDDLRVALHHAVIAQSGVDQFIIQSLAPSGIWHNDELVKSAALADGDKVRIGNYQIEVGRSTPGYDLVLTVESLRSGHEKGLDALRPRGMLERTGWSLRRMSWTLALSAATLFLLLPLLGFLVPPLGSLMRDYATPVSDSAWTPGKSSHDHEYFAKDCGKCHVSAFVPVRDADCKQCHKDTQRHASKAGDAVRESQCTECHKEHQGPQGVVYQSDGLCLDCHDDIKGTYPDSKLLDVKSGFPEGHPEFRASVQMADAAGGEPKTVRVSLEPGSKPPVEENSGLLFNHKHHLKEEGIKGPKRPGAPDDLVKLDCKDCHVPEPGGKLMQPVSFEQHCHSCHKLTINPRDNGPDKDREVPHGQPEEVLTILRSYYSDFALGCQQPTLSPEAPADGGGRLLPGAGGGAELGEEAAADCAALRPGANGRLAPGEGCGRDSNAQEPLKTLDDPELPQALKDVCEKRSANFSPETLKQTHAWIDESAETTRKNLLYTYRACGACHDRKADNSDIIPAHPAKSWLPKARFDHSRHEAIQAAPAAEAGPARFDPDCLKCHDAKESETSHDVLIKGIGTCRECHSDTGGGHTTASSCVSCHAYHGAEGEEAAGPGHPGGPAGAPPQEGASEAPQGHPGQGGA
jgi:predicted CXXCH cytochrome family protein